jgi:hypothetical protein
MRLSDIAKVIRSKNAGPRCTTLDIMFATEADYQRVVNSNKITEALVCRCALNFDHPCALNFDQGWLATFC